MTTDSEQVALDAIKAIGIDGVSVFHMRCVASFLDGMNDRRWPSTRNVLMERLEFDLRCSSVDSVRCVAEWEESRRVAERSRRTVLQNSPGVDQASLFRYLESPQAPVRSHLSWLLATVLPE